MSQEYYYDYCFIRDNLGKFNKLDKKGTFSIKNNTIFLFDQVLEVSSSRVVFGEKQESIGRIYTCTDKTYFYTLFLTTDDELYFYDKNQDMIKFKLKKIE